MSTPSQSATQYMFRHQDLVAVLLKHLDIHEGCWSLSVNLAFAAMNIGTTPEGTDISPAAITRLDSIGIQRAPHLDPANPLIIDAAVVNPKA
ncbi:MAG: hypothetical protein ACRYHA_19875 [Janthinobacterium lividum]